MCTGGGGGGGREGAFVCKWLTEVGGHTKVLNDCDVELPELLLKDVQFVHDPLRLQPGVDLPRAPPRT